MARMLLKWKPFDKFFDGHFSPSIGLIEILVSVILSLGAVFLNLIFMFKAGAFWRDEAGSITLATMTSLKETWHYLSYDSFFTYTKNVD